MARLLIVGGGQRGRRLAQRISEQGHVARIVTRRQDGREAIERAGAECFLGDPARLATVTAALEGVSIGCWLLGCASGAEEDLQALHGPRLEAFLTRTVDTHLRGFVYEAAGTVDPQLLAGGAAAVRRICEANEVPFRAIDADPGQREAWLAQAEGAVAGLLGGR